MSNPLTAEQASFLRDQLVDELEREVPATGRVLESLPADRMDWRPHPLATPAGELAWHLADGQCVLLECLGRGTFAGISVAPMPEGGGTAMAAVHAKRMAKALAALRALPGETLVRPLEAFFGPERPLVEQLWFVLGHTAHHRGQLSAYLRAMGATVPGVYGPSADERRRPRG